LSSDFALSGVKTNIILFTTLMLKAASAWAGPSTEAWVQRYNHEFGANDQATKIVTDSAGNVIVAGTSSTDSSAGGDFLLIKYTGAGVALWTNRYNGPTNGDDYPTALVVDGSGNVYVTGSSYNGSSSDYATIAYSSAGVALWTNRYDAGGLYNGGGSGGDTPSAIALGGNGNVYVTGRSYAYSLTFNDWYPDYATVAYSSAGVALWTNRYNGPGDGDDAPSAIAVGGNGNVYVTGYAYSGSSDDYTTVAYSSAGAVLWTRRYNGGVGEASAATAIAVDGSGKVYVTGWSASEAHYEDFVTVAYTSAGVALWTNRYNGPDDGVDYPTAMAVDGSGNVYVTGYTSMFSGSAADYETIAYTSAGVALWTNRYNGPANNDDRATAIAVDGSGSVNVMGYSGGDYTTVAYTSAGLALSTNHYGFGQSASIAADGSGKVFVTGVSSGISSPDFVTTAYTSAGIPLWTNRYDGPGGIGNARASAVAVTGSGNVYVTGYSAGWGGYSDYATIAFTSSGVTLWTNRYHGPGSRGDQAKAIAVDGSGTVYVTGFSFGSSGYSDYATVAYNGVGVALWTNRYHGPVNGDDKAIAIAVDGSDKVFVTGSSFGSGSSSDYATISYNSAGVALWTNRYSGPGISPDNANAIAVDASGNVYVTGRSYSFGTNADYVTVAYSTAGVGLWTNRYNGPGNSGDEATAIAVDGSGKVFVTGNSANDYATIAYTSGGVALWTNRYDGPGNSGDYATAIAADGNGHVYVTGYSYGASGFWDYATIAYTSGGAPLWTNRYNGPGNATDQAAAIAVDKSGNVYVTGYSEGSGSAGDCTTVAYSSVGVAWWTNRYNGPGNGYDQATAIAVDGNYNVYVAGYSTPTIAKTDYALVKYTPSDPRLEITSDGGDGFFVRYAGLTDFTFRLQRAASVTGPWSDIATNALEYHEAFPLPGQAFYRAVQP
jgi:uncharacterized delta-60 repeat protein